MELIIARHGESFGNIVNYDCPDPELTPTGVRQAELLAKRLADENFDIVLCSPLVRSLETAWIICQNRKEKPHVYINLREVRALSGHTGLTGNELKRRYPGIHLEGDGFYDDKGWIDPGDETREKAYLRAQSVISDLKQKYQGEERILMVTHGTLNGFLMTALLGLGLESDIRFGQSNTCINGFQIENGRCKVLYINDKSHLNAV